MNQDLSNIDFPIYESRNNGYNDPLLRREDGTFPIKEGDYPAVCIFVADMGLQTDEYKGVKKDHHKMALGFELPIPGSDERAIVYTTFNNTTFRNGGLAQLANAVIKTRKDGMDLTEPDVNGKKFSAVQLLGKTMFARIKTHSKKGAPYKRAVLAGVYAQPYDTPGFTEQTVTPKTKPFAYVLSMGKNEAFEQLPYFLRQDIAKNLDPQATDGKSIADQITDCGEPIDVSDLPF